MFQTKAGEKTRHRVQRKRITAKNTLVVCCCAGFMSLITVNAQETSESASPSTSHSSTETYRSPTDGGARRFRILSGGETNLYKNPTANAAIVGTLANGTIVSNRGCVTAQFAIWCNVRPLHEKKKGFVNSQNLEAAIGPDGMVARGIDKSPNRARKGDFDAQTNIPCAQEVGETLGQCKASISRDAGGDAAIVVTFSNSFSRILYFQHGKFIRGNATMSGVGIDTDWKQDGGIHYIRIDDQRFEISNSFVLGK